MGFLTRTEFNSLEDLFVEQLKDLYDAEQRLVEALPKMADAANSSSLKKAFSDHLEGNTEPRHSFGAGVQ